MADCCPRSCTSKSFILSPFQTARSLVFHRMFLGSVGLAVSLRTSLSRHEKTTMHPVNAVSKVARSSGLERNWLLEACGSWISSDWICTNDALIIVVSLHIDAMVIPASLNLEHKSRSVVAEVRPTAVILACVQVRCNSNNKLHR